MNQLTSKKYLIASVHLVSSALFLYITVAYLAFLWPFHLPTHSASLRSVEPLLSPSITMTKLSADPEKNVLTVETVIDTTEQGLCKLTLSSKDKIYVLTSTTEGVDGRSGCLGWNVGTSNFASGDYKVEVKFMGKTQTATMSDKIRLS